MRTASLLTACLLWIGPAAALAQTHTIVALSHSDHTAYEVDPASGKILNKFTAVERAARRHRLGRRQDVLRGGAQRAARRHPRRRHVQGEGPDRITRSFDRRGRTDRRLRTASRSRPMAASSMSASKTPTSPASSSTTPGPTRCCARSTSSCAAAISWRFSRRPTSSITRCAKTTASLVIDTKTDQIVKVLPIEGGPVGVGFAPNGDVWIHNDGDGAVHVIDGKTDTVVKTLKGLGIGAGRMAVSPDGKWAASTHGGSQDVAIIDAVTKEVGGTRHHRPWSGVPGVLTRWHEALHHEFRRRRRVRRSI